MEQIRAANLSGDCRWSREVMRGFYSFSKQHQVGLFRYQIPDALQACVKRRAVVSVLANPNCEDLAMAEKAVNEVWESCLKDTRPFDEVCLGYATLA